MALFKRTPKDQTIADLERYYNQYGSRSGKAWLVALASLFTTVVVLVGLFFGGRWLYRAVSEDDAPVATTQSQPDTQAPEAADKPLSDYLPKNDDNTTQEGTVSDEAASTSESNADRVAAATTNTPATTLPATGPGLTLIVMILLTTVIAGYTYQMKRQNSKVV